MSMNYEYVYAEIDPSTKMCLGVFTSTASQPESETLVAIPVYDPDYMLKYYIDGNWYEDAEGTIPWTSSLL